MIRVLLAACVLLLSACVSQAPLPASTPSLALPLQLLIQRQQAEQRQDWLLVVQAEGPGLRWSLMDPLGIPLARQKLLDGQWQADGLLPPNPEARELFAALLFALTPEAQVPGNYPQAHQQGSQRDLGQRWRVHYQQPLDFQLNLPQGLRYHITALSAGSTP
ncbi:hypothetical protein BK634_09025 [Pseudomonas chlororaphis]|jgi:hypothetical protein|uniref:DUF3261 domain-containing protein n=1 Tax=Pseudomonas morbosilactucae TaxID=2938197 RepID=A0ABT0JKW1_9PSED|nr:hypothetical protein [Pseudomonas morbosilactucae]MCK9816554.1 hypothetical protein [Pseudomonas morbosilactucae]ROL71270.1 hypothetical protein BK634_09025 [Pseudomonas chlororaphis]WEK10349.1 MAG: hypothetical protein P0Y51_05460 [Pseudomonas sp.]